MLNTWSKNLIDPIVLTAGTSTQMLQHTGADVAGETKGVDVDQIWILAIFWPIA